MTTSIAEKDRFQSARVILFDPRRGYGRAFTKDGRIVTIPRQCLLGQDLVTLDSGSTTEVALDELNPKRAEQVRLLSLMESAATVTEKKRP